MVDLILFVLLGLAVTVLSVWGGIVSAKSLPARENKPLHVGGSITCGVIAFSLTVIIGVRNYSAQKKAEGQQSQLSRSLRDANANLARANRSLDHTNQILQQSTLSQEFMKGQLSGLSMMVGKLDSGGSVESGGLAKALRQLGSGPVGPTNAQLADGAKDLARRFRELQRTLDGLEVDEMQKHKNLNFPPGFFQYELSLVQPLRIEAVALRHQILDKIPAQPENGTVTMVLDQNSIAGPHPLYDVADYFDELARVLLLK